MIQSVDDLIQYHEGCVLAAIPDTNGFSIGYGHDGAIKGQTCTQAEADAWFAWDFAVATQRAMTDLTPAYWDKLDIVRRAALQDMAYELGGAGLSAFAKMLQAIRAEDWVTARLEALNSQWAHQVLSRAVMDAEMLLTGEWPAI